MRITNDMFARIMATKGHVGFIDGPLDPRLHGLAPAEAYIFGDELEKAYRDGKVRDEDAPTFRDCVMFKTTAEAMSKSFWNFLGPAVTAGALMASLGEASS